MRGLFYRRRSRGGRLRIGRRVEIVGRDNVTLGRDVALWGNTYLNANGEHGSIAVGDGSHIDQFCVLYGQGGLTIGARCAIAAGVTIYTQTNQYRAAPQKEILAQPVIYAPVKIGDDVWIGARAVILPGVIVGSHAVVGAGAVVTRNVPEWRIVAGVPAADLGDRRAAAKRG